MASRKICVCWRLDADGALARRSSLSAFVRVRYTPSTLTPEMVKLARNRLSAYGPDGLLLYVGDAAAIAEEDSSFDAVFDFGIIHHVPEWKRAVAEVARVLRPGGWFFFEEVTSQALNRWSYRTFLDHPTENRFNSEEFVAEVERHRITVGSNYVEWFFGDFVTGVGHLAGMKDSGNH